MKFHEVCYFWVGLDLLSSLRGLSPGTVSWWFSSSSFSRISPVLGGMASFFVADEALSIPDVFRFVAWREIDLVYLHGVWVNL